MKTSNKKIGTEIFLSIVFAVLITGILKICLDKVNSQKNSCAQINNWSDGIGTISSRTYGRGGTIKINYYFNDSQYNENSDIYISGLVAGEKYLMKINPKMPGEFYVLDWKPVFTTGESTEKTTGKITRVFRYGYGKGIDSSSGFGVEFEYTVSNTSYSRSQHLPPNYQSIYPSLKKDQTYEVEYWIDDPNRAIIHLNVPTVPSL